MVKNKKMLKISKMSKKGQEEMVGFALIIIVVAVIILVFLGISLRSPEKEPVESYEADSFIQAMLQYHTDCQDSGSSEELSVQELIFSCNIEESCSDGRNSCDVLNSTLWDISEEGWKISHQVQGQAETPIKGYGLKILVNEMEMLSFSKGKISENSRGARQDFIRKGNVIKIFFTVYY